MDILLVDDDAIDREVVKRALKNNKDVTSLHEACSADEGLKAAAKGRFDVLLLDYRMPQVDGIEKRGKDAFRLVRNSIETKDKKVRKMVTDSSDRFDNRREQLRNDMDNLEKRIKAEMKELKDSINSKIKKALENPLAGIRKN